MAKSLPLAATESVAAGVLMRADQAVIKATDGLLQHFTPFTYEFYNAAGSS